VIRAGANDTHTALRASMPELEADFRIRAEYSKEHDHDGAERRGFIRYAPTAARVALCSSTKFVA